jgi:hypothetical protein
LVTNQPWPSRSEGGLDFEPSTLNFELRAGLWLIEA